MNIAAVVRVFYTLHKYQKFVPPYLGVSTFTHPSGAVLFRLGDSMKCDQRAAEVTKKTAAVFVGLQREKAAVIQMVAILTTVQRRGEMSRKLRRRTEWMFKLICTLLQSCTDLLRFLTIFRDFLGVDTESGQKFGIFRGSVPSPDKIFGRLFTPDPDKSSRIPVFRNRPQTP